jgi:hypothetical protein
MPSPFTLSHGSVHWQGVRLSGTDCERLLDLFERERAVAPFNELYALHMQAGGIERVSTIINQTEAA